MSDLGWHADGISRARAAGGIELELYRRPGFAGGMAVRRSDTSGSAYGFSAPGMDDTENPPEFRADKPRSKK